MMAKQMLRDNVCAHLSCDYVSHLLLCSGCRETAYCSKECQQKDWERHKKNCSKRHQFSEDKRSLKPINPIKRQKTVAAPPFTSEMQVNILYLGEE